MILLGAVPVSLLALLFDFIFAKLEQAVTSEGLLPNEQIQNLPKKVIRRRQVIAVGVCVAWWWSPLAETWSTRSLTST